MTAALYLLGFDLAVGATVILSLVRAGPSVRPADLNVLLAGATVVCFALALVVIFI